VKLLSFAESCTSSTADFIPGFAAVTDSKKCFAPTRDDHLISELMKRLGKCPANTGTSTSDENRVTCHLHVLDLLNEQNRIA
jgi:hypothetical protein